VAYTRFVLISHLRSGTHLLRSLLESHPAIVCQSEVFNSDDPDLPYPLTTSSREVLDRWVYREFEPPVRCAGFVLQVYHPLGLKAFPGIRENPHWLDVWDILEGMPELRVIHLRRGNHLRRHLSHVMARQSGDWHRWEPDRLDDVTHLHRPEIPGVGGAQRPVVRLDAGRLREDFEEVEQLHARVTGRFRHHAYLPLSYEFLCDQPELAAQRLTQFLGVDSLPLRPAVSKLELRPLAECIENFSELKSEFSGTRWSGLFDEPNAIPGQDAGMMGIVGP